MPLNKETKPASDMKSAFLFVADIFLPFLPFSTYILSDSLHLFTHKYTHTHIYMYIVFLEMVSFSNTINH